MKKMWRETLIGKVRELSAELWVTCTNKAFSVTDNSKATKVIVSGAQLVSVS